MSKLPAKSKSPAHKSNASFEFNWRRSIDFFRFEHRKFERDVLVIVMGSLDAGVKQLAREFKLTESRFDTRLAGTTPEQEDWIIDDFIDIREEHEDQERFLRNIAIVALLSRLTHTLHGLARHGDELAPRDQNGYPGENEFKELWMEFRTRFGIQVPPKHIQWIEPFRRARNLIVHNGGEANPLTYGHEKKGAPVVTRDTSFSKRYRQFVEGEDHAAEVRITQVQLTRAADKAMELSAWLAQELRKQQMETNKASITARSSDS
jgi:hypothetical protein